MLRLVTNDRNGQTLIPPGVSVKEDLKPNGTASIAASQVIIGVISDTHGLLRAEAVEALRGSNHIIHAGDIGDPAIVGQLEEIAPVTAVRGNVDREPWATKFPESNVLQAGGLLFYVLHRFEDLDLKPEAAGFAAVIYGHSHVPKQEMKNGVLYFNPGSAGPRRFKLPITVGWLFLEDGELRGEITTIVR